MSEYEEIQAQIAELQRKAAAIRVTERATAITDIKSLMATFEISLSELAPNTSTLKQRSSTVASPMQKVAPKYRDGSGNEWSGRGLRPRWLTAAIANGKSAESFLIS